MHGWDRWGNAPVAPSAAGYRYMQHADGSWVRTLLAPSLWPRIKTPIKTPTGAVRFLSFKHSRTFSFLIFRGHSRFWAEEDIELTASLLGVGKTNTVDALKRKCFDSTRPKTPDLRLFRSCSCTDWASRPLAACQHAPVSPMAFLAGKRQRLNPRADFIPKHRRHGG